MFCSRCGNPYTLEDRKKNRFCEECGTYRPMQIAGLSAQKWRGRRHRPSKAYFPYEPYPQQNAFMKDIREIVCRGGILIAEACNGFGKSICSLSATLSAGRGIVYATRTHEQALQVIKEIRRVNTSTGPKYTAIQLASRTNLCLNETCRQLQSSNQVEGCRELRERNRCPYKWDDLGTVSRIPRILSIQKLRSFGFSEGICPYFLARNLINDRDIVIGPYQYFFDQGIRSKVGLGLGGKILIFDEAHNSDKIGTEVLSSSLSSNTLEQAKEELKGIRQPSGFLSILEDYLEEKTVEDSDRVEIGENIVKEIGDKLGISDITPFTEAFTKVIDEIREKRVEKGETPRSHLSGVIQFLQIVFSRPPDSYVGIFRRMGREAMRLDYRCLDPSLAIQPVVEEAFGTLIMSGTLSPMDFFAEMIGLGSAAKRNYEAIANPDKITAYLDSTVTTKFNERTPAMLLKYGRRIKEFLKKNQVKSGSLVFFPQRNLMTKTLEAWEREGLVGRSQETLFLGERELFVEGRRAAENRVIVERFKEKAARSAAILLGVFRGRNAEGSNFPDDEVRTIFLIGIPYANYTDPVVRAQIDYFNRRKKGLGERWYIMDAFRAANQAAGRGIRHRKDWCRYVFMDKRYRGWEKLVSPWILKKGFKEL